MQTSTPVGGYFSREIPSQRPVLLPWIERATHFQTARAAFAAVLMSRRLSAIWLPDYICPDMVDAANRAATKVKFYPPTRGLGVPAMDLKKGENLLVVNYFGLHSARVREAMDAYPAEQVIVDNAQAFYAPPAESRAVIYSPRKFFGVADGGLLVGENEVSQPLNEDSGSRARGAYLDTRLQFGPESGYAQYQAAEADLADQDPLSMSGETRRAIMSLDMPAAGAIRRANYQCLYDLLGSSYAPRGCLGPDDVPLCYPIANGSPGLRRFLIAKRIFSPTYWPHVQSKLQDSIAEAVAESTVALPIDQRYGISDMERVAEAVLAYSQTPH